MFPYNWTGIVLIMSRWLKPPTVCKAFVLETSRKNCLKTGRKNISRVALEAVKKAAGDGMITRHPFADFLLYKTMVFYPTRTFDR